jgi:hypothetical protein
MSAIQPDVQSDAVSTTPAAPAAEAPQKTPREAALEALEARHQAEMAKANGWELEAEPEPEPSPEPQPQDQLQTQLADPAPEPEPAATLPAKVKVKIDGEEAEVPVDDLVRQYQKNATADKRLAEATRLLREAQEAEAQRLLREQQHQQYLQQQLEQQQQQAPTQNPAGDDPLAAGKDFIKALFSGDEENAEAKLVEMLAGRQQAQAAPAPILDVNEIASTVAQQVQQKLVVESVLNQNRRDYPEMYADPDLEALALTKIQRMQAEEGTDFFAALDTVSKQMAQKFGWSAAQQEPGRREDPVPATSSRATKLEAKQKIDNVSSINTKTAPTEPQPEDASSIIAAMKAARAGG